MEGGDQNPYTAQRATGHMQSSPEASVLSKGRMCSEDRAGRLSVSPYLKARGVPQRAQEVSPKEPVLQTPDRRATGPWGRARLCPCPSMCPEGQGTCPRPRPRPSSGKRSARQAGGSSRAWGPSHSLGGRWLLARAPSPRARRPGALPGCFQSQVGAASPPHPLRGEAKAACPAGGPESRS